MEKPVVKAVSYPKNIPTLQHKRRKRRWRGFLTLLVFGMLHFIITFLGKKGCFLCFEREKWSFTTVKSF